MSFAALRQPPAHLERARGVRAQGRRPQRDRRCLAVKELPGLAANESAVVNFGREFFRTRWVSRGAL